MFRTRSLKILADTRSRFSRTILASLSIMMGVFGVTLLVSANNILIDELQGGMPPEEIAMLKIYTVLPQGELSLEDNQAIINQISAIDGVTHAQGLAMNSVAWQSDDADHYTNGVLMSYTAPLDQLELETVNLMDGAYPAVGQGEVAVERRLADQHDIRVGDTVSFRAPDPNAPPIEMTVSGIIYQPFFTLGSDVFENVEASEMIFAHYDDAQVIANASGINSIYVRYPTFEEAQANATTLENFISTETPYISTFTFPEDPDDSFIVGQVTAVTDVLNVLAIMSMVVSGFLVVNVISTIIVEQKRQIGVMKSIGSSRFDVFFIYGGMALIFGVIGTVLGVALGIPAAAMMASELAPFALTYVDGFQISLTGIGLAVALGLLVPTVVSILPVLNGMRVKIVDAMMDVGIASDWGTGWQAHAIQALPLPIGIRQAISNIAQKKGRLALTGFTLTLAVASFMGVVAVLMTINAEIDDFFGDLPYDLTISPQDGQNFETMEATLLNNSDEIDTVFPGYFTTGRLIGYEAAEDVEITGGSDQVAFIGIDPASEVLDIELSDGEGWKNDPSLNGVILSDVHAAQLDVSSGDTVTVSLNSQPHELTVIGIRDTVDDTLIIRWDSLATMAGFVDENGQPLTNQLYVGLVDDDPSLEAIDDVIGNVEEVMLNNGIPADYLNRVEEAETSAMGVQVFGIIFGIMAGVMAAVGAVGLLAALSMAVFERQKEIGVLRSVGASSSSILSQFLTEGVMIGLIAWIVALPLSYVLGEGLLGSLPFEGITYDYPVPVPFIGFIGVVLLSALASLLPAISASRKTVSDILRYQ